MYECIFCKKTFDYLSSFNRHNNKKNKCDTLVDYESMSTTLNNKINEVEIKITNINNEITDKTANSLVSDNTCQFCNKTYVSKGNLARHIENTCHERNKLRKKKEQFLNELCEYNSKKNIYGAKKNEKDKEKLIEEIKKIINSENSQISQNIINNITNNNNNNITNNLVVINSFGNEDLSHITITKYKTYLNTFFKGFRNFIEQVHFNENVPANHNICITNLRSKEIKVYENNKWIVKNKSEVIDRLLHKKINILIDKCEELEDKNEISQDIIDNFAEFQENFSNKDAKKTTKDDIIMMIYNNKNKILNTK